MHHVESTDRVLRAINHSSMEGMFETGYGRNCTCLTDYFPQTPDGRSQSGIANATKQKPTGPRFICWFAREDSIFRPRAPARNGYLGRCTTASMQMPGRPRRTPTSRPGCGMSHVSGHPGEIPGTGEQIVEAECGEPDPDILSNGICTGCTVRSAPRKTSFACRS
jgi:hypothetical protein